METLIVICLLVVIFLLLEDKFVIKKRPVKKESQEKAAIILPQIMGLPRPATRLSTPKNAPESQSKEQEPQSDNLATEIKEDDFDIEIPQEEPEEVFSQMPDFEDEEKEWGKYRVSDGEDGFATGVTFEELSTVGMLLSQEMPEPSLEKQAVDIVRKIQGTELFSLLENSMEGASRRIADLLDRSLSAEADPGSSILRNNNLSDFNIGDFV
ncbi:conjugal transfer protein TraD [Pedobacter sp. ISL-68]|uniref:conjugal transfer protein TraD n=1 Tax=unclassified Pedobacter TaxID=2628915 RepID=UPI001BE57379|nr:MULTISPECIES: conjugal transfer protein TraD [unclassified Pedobacter]MBT2559807.1 conjugal transfer protein TraD [Pedobacter sp. ISL-64]MBT2592112.1 conjugal transfer protein TraD [Pedobacter sp. ISL-68]